jgi:hypothetical protein
MLKVGEAYKLAQPCKLWKSARTNDTQRFPKGEPLIYRGFADKTYVFTTVCEIWTLKLTENLLENYITQAP